MLVASTKPKKKKNPKKKKGPVVKDLFGDIMEEESQMIGNTEQDEYGDQENNDIEDTPLKEDIEYNNIVGSLYDNRPKEKAYTLTIICDPEEAGIE